MDKQKVQLNNDDCNNGVSKKCRFWEEWKQGNINILKGKGKLSIRPNAKQTEINLQMLAEESVKSCQVNGQN